MGKSGVSMTSRKISFRSSSWLYAIVLCVAFPALSMASGGGAMLHANNDVGDVASLQRGARNFVNYCMGCHTAKYIRFSKLQEDLKLSEEQVIENLMFAAKRTDELMTIAMPAADAEKWFGQAPPDLTLVSRSRGTDWVYSFLKSFYLDDRAKTGVNNLLLPNASMPHVLWELQGLQEATFASTMRNGRVTNNFGNPEEFQEFEITQPGTMSTEEYDQFVLDLVNFLDWAGTPEQLERQALGIWVILFLLVFLIFAYLLKVEIWKDVK
jgi:ubiquinol-cytochrome c reductase cytochrome c1 subunit